MKPTIDSIEVGGVKIPVFTGTISNARMFSNADNGIHIDGSHSHMNLNGVTVARNTRNWIGEFKMDGNDEWNPAPAPKPGHCGCGRAYEPIVVTVEGESWLELLCISCDFPTKPGPVVATTEDATTKPGRWVDPLGGQIVVNLTTKNMHLTAMGPRSVVESVAFHEVDPETIELTMKNGLGPPTPIYTMRLVKGERVTATVNGCTIQVREKT